MEIPGGGGGGEYYEAPWKGKSWVVVVKLGKTLCGGGGGGVWIFSGTTQFPFSHGVL